MVVNERNLNCKSNIAGEIISRRQFCKVCFEILGRNALILLAVPTSLSIPEKILADAEGNRIGQEFPGAKRREYTAVIASNCRDCD